MRLGSLSIDNPFVQAPMAGVTDSAFRNIARHFHEGLIFTEMISAEALCRGNWRTIKFLEWVQDQRPIGVQLVGHHPERMAQAATLACEMDIDIIDINAGCPQQKVVGPGAGGALMKKPEKLAEILDRVRRSVDLPVSVKIRLGDSDNQGLRIGRMLEEHGADFITVHGRTVEQKYTGRADWHAIREVVEGLDIPVLANGDARDEASSLQMLEFTGAAGVMIGRATRGRPDLPGTAYSLLKTGRYERMSQRILAQTISDHARLEQELFGEQAGIRRMRKHLHWYLRAADIKVLARDIYHIETLEEIKSMLNSHVLGKEY